MQYELRAINVSSGTLEIREEEFKEIAAAKRGLIIATGFEEKFYLVLENYAEFEQTLLNLTLHRLIFLKNEWTSFQDNILVLNRRLANLLAATRSYLDQVDHELISLFGSDSTVVRSVRKARNTEYKKCIGYRAMEALRNYTQHKAFPIHHLSFGVQRDEGADRVHAAHTIMPSLSITEVRRDSQMKSNVLEELTASGPLVPLTPLIREYVECLGRVHSQLRSSVAAEVARWEQTLKASMDRARTRCGDSDIGFVAAAFGGDADGEEVYLFTEFIQRRQLLECRTRHARWLSNHYVTGQIPKRDG